MEKKLEKFHLWLKEHFKDYICMIGTGSFVTGDKWIEGKSDKDIILVFEKPYGNNIFHINDYLKKNSFDEIYLFVPMLKEKYLKSRKHSHDFSGKFRSLVLFGPDIIKNKELPSTEETKTIFLKGIDDVKRRLERVLINESIWTEKKIKKTLWKLFKHTFMYLAIKYYFENDVYPIKRSDLVNLTKEPILKKTLKFLYEINSKKREELLYVAKSLLEYLENEN